jgi:choline dehydrogenase-like flavoprotein
MSSIHQITFRQPADSIICGGGTAGLVLAARLSGDPDVPVIVIEAGENLLNDSLVETPARFTQIFNEERIRLKI